jgi:hypothetical protein
MGMRTTVYRALHVEHEGDGAPTTDLGTHATLQAAKFACLMNFVQEHELYEYTEFPHGTDQMEWETSDNKHWMWESGQTVKRFGHRDTSYYFVSEEHEESDAPTEKVFVVQMIQDDPLVLGAFRHLEQAQKAAQNYENSSCDAAGDEKYVLTWGESQFKHPVGGRMFHGSSHGGEAIYAVIELQLDKHMVF